MTTSTAHHPAPRLRGVALVRTIQRRTAQGQTPAEIARDLGVTPQYVSRINARHWSTAGNNFPRYSGHHAPEMVRFEDWDTAAAIDLDEARRCREMGLIEVEMPCGVLRDGVRIFRRAA